MKKIARSLILASLAFVFVASFYKGISFNSLQSLAIAAIIFAFLAQFVKPVIKLLTLPFNLLTFGLISGLINLFILYLVKTAVAGFDIVAFNFQGVHLAGFILPAFYLAPIFSALLASFLIGLTQTFLQFIFR